MKIFTETQLKRLLMQAYEAGFSKAIANETGFDAQPNDWSAQTIMSMHQTLDKLVAESSKLSEGGLNA